MKASRAPIYADSFDLCEWILGQFGDDPAQLPIALSRTALTLHEAVTLALKGRRQDDHLEIADEALIRLRSQLRLAEAREYLDSDQLMHVLELTDSIGRQLGGWIKRLDAV